MGRPAKTRPARRSDGDEPWMGSRLLRVMAHPVRLKILAALLKGPQCVRDLNAFVDIVQPHLSQHMAALRRAKIVDCHSCGALRCYYVLRVPLVRDVLDALRADPGPRHLDRAGVLRIMRSHGKDQQ